VVANQRGQGMAFVTALWLKMRKRHEDREISETMIEYAFILAVIASAGVAAYQIFGTSITLRINSVANLF
jgi:Flp pilus assembly pilin Flp